MRDLKLPLPSLLTVIKEIAYPRLPTLRGKQKARSIDIAINSSKELEVKEEKLGLAGSPTRVVKIYHPKVTRKGTLLQVKDEKSLQQAVDSLISYLKQKKIL